MKKVVEKIRSFIDSDIFIALIFMFTVCAWYYRIQIVAMSIYVVFLALIVLVDARRINIITLIMATVINYRIAKMEENLKIMIIYALVILPIVIYEFVRRTPKINHPIFIAMVLFLGVNILSLVNVTKDTLVFGLVGVAQVLLYTVLFLYFNTNKTEMDYKKIAKNAMAMGLAIAAEMVLLLMGLKGKTINKSMITLGWGLSNFIAITVSVLIPLTFYLYLDNSKNKLALFAVVLEFLVVLITLSKGAYLAWTVLVIPMIGYAFISMKKTKRILLDGVLILIFLGGLFLVIRNTSWLWEAMKRYLDNMDERGWFNDPGRIKIYKTGFDLFKKYPLLGAGSYTGQYYLEQNINFHNYFIQTIASLGSLGLISFGYFIFCVVKKAWVKDPFNIMVIFILVEMSIHGLVDTTWYNPLIMVILAFVFPNLREKAVEKNLENL